MAIGLKLKVLFAFTLAVMALMWMPISAATHDHPARHTVPIADATEDATAVTTSDSSWGG